MTKYNVILADPPWKYKNDMVYKRKGEFIQGPNSKSLNHYCSMTLDELSHMGISSMCESPCVLYMWSTGPKLRDAISLGEAWGFSFRQVAFVWDKTRICPGNYTLTQTEFVLVFGHKNYVLPKRHKTNVRQLFSECKREHSRKPEYVQDMLDLMYPDMKKLELFARRTRPGWDVWGNETNKFDEKGDN